MSPGFWGPVWALPALAPLAWRHGLMERMLSS